MPCQRTPRRSDRVDCSRTVGLSLAVYRVVAWWGGPGGPRGFPMRKTGGLGLVLVVGTLALSGTFALPRASFACVTAADCDDGNPCTDDLCDTAGCFYSQISTACDDGNACSTGDVCNSGTCVGGAIATGCTSCQAIATLPAAGGTFVGATSGTGTMTASCGSTGPSPERVYRWTPRPRAPRSSRPAARHALRQRPLRPQRRPAAVPSSPATTTRRAARPASRTITTARTCRSR